MLNPVQLLGMLGYLCSTHITAAERKQVDHGLTAWVRPVAMNVDHGDVGDVGDAARRRRAIGQGLCAG